MNNAPMTDQQQIAQTIYLESVCVESDYKPVSFPKLLDLLEKEGIKSSTSTLSRWCEKFQWNEKVKVIVTAATLDGGDAADIIAKSSLEKSTTKILQDFEANETLKNDAYAILGKQMVYYAAQMDRMQYLSLDNTKMVIKILEVTSTREDKLLDRQAMLAATKLMNSGDVLKALHHEVIDVEMDEE